MADNNPDILKQFQEFMEAKAAKDAEESESEDFEIEIWNKDGAGVRTKRSHAKPFLQQLGLDLDPEPESDSGTDDKGKPKPNSKPKGPTNPAPSTARKYFTKP